MAVTKNATSRTRPKKRGVIEEGAHVYRCYVCGKETDRPISKFYKTNSRLWAGNDGYFPVCCDCLNELLQEYTKRYDARTAMMIICHYMDIPFHNMTFDTMNINTGSTLSVGSYSRLMNNVQFSGKSFVNTLVDGELLKDRSDITEAREVKWSTADLNNKKYVLSRLGYDPFDDESYTDEDRKFLFNTLNGYLTDEVLEDPHRTQSAINMMPSFLQRSKIDKLINSDLLTRAPSNLKQYTDAKTALDRTLSIIANENGFSVKGAGKMGKNSSAITEIMRKMEEDKFAACKVNFVDAKIADAYQQVADISNRSLMNQLNWTEDDYARMVAKQRDMIRKLNDTQLKLIEEARQLREIVTPLVKDSKIKLPPPTDISDDDEKDGGK